MDVASKGHFINTYIIDDLEVSVGGQLYLGPDDTLFGTIEESQSAYYAELRASF